MDPFHGEEQDQLSVEEDLNHGDDVQALLQADLEMSPLVTHTPPTLQNQFVVGLSGGPALPRTPKDHESTVLSPKKRKADDAMLTEKDFSQLPTQSDDGNLQENQKKTSSPQEQPEGQSASDQKQMADGGEHPSKKIKLDSDLTPSNNTNPTEQSNLTPVSLPHETNIRDLLGAVTASTSEIAQGQEVSNESNLTEDRKEMTTVIPPPPASMTPEKREAMRKQDILAIVTGTRTPVSNKPDDTKSESRKPETQGSLSLSALKQDKNAFRRDRKRAPKPIRRILNARKETEQAIDFIENVADLLDYLPEDDCKFLAGSSWIFTKDQLHGVLDPSSFIDDSTLHMEEWSQLKESAEAMRIKLRDKLAERLYFERRPEEKQIYADYRKAVVKAMVEECKTGDFVPVPFPFFKSRNQSDGETNDPSQCDEASKQSEESQTGLLSEKKTPEETTSPSLNQQSSTSAAPKSGVEESGIVSEREVKKGDMHETFSSNPFNMPRPATSDTTPAHHNFPAPQLLSSHVFSFYNQPKEIISGVESVLAKRPSTDLSPKEERDIARAETKMTEWLRRLKKSPQKLTPAEDGFNFDGPISVLIPNSSRSFLATVKLMSLFKFLRTRRTETGALCEMLQIFRQECQLPYLNHLALARHLIGLSTRMEAAVGSRLPLDDKTRRWMSGSL